MKNLALLPLLLLSSSVLATETEIGDNTVQMSDGVEMELINGDFIIMKNTRLWRSVNPKKRHDHQKLK